MKIFEYGLHMHLQMQMERKLDITRCLVFLAVKWLPQSQHMSNKRMLAKRMKHRS